MSDSDRLEWFMEQVRREQSRVRALVRSLGVRADAVDDLAQEAFILAHAKLGDFDRTQDFGVWVRGIARHLVANALRKEARRQQILADHLTEFLLKADELEASVLLRNEARLKALNECVAALPDRSRQLMHWRYFEDQSAGAIASRLDRTANDVRQLLFRLRQELRQCLEKKLSGHEC